MGNTPQLLRRYVDKSLRTVKGYLTPLDARVIAALLAYQHDRNITGHLCEIGVHHGRLFLLLAIARRPGERALAIDLFEDDAINANTNQAGRDRALSANARRLRIELSEDEILKGSSLDLGAAEILKRTTGPIRFFSVDGCHLDKYVQNDLHLAERTLTPDAIVAVDDFFNRDCPDVSFATCSYLRDTDALVPFAITASKLYLASPQAAEGYKSALRKSADLPPIYAVQMLGRETLAFRQGVVRKAYSLLRSLILDRPP